MSGYVDVGFTFVVDDLAELQIQQITVPIVEDHIEWQCKVTFV